MIKNLYNELCIRNNDLTNFQDMFSREIFYGINQRRATLNSLLKRIKF